MLLHATLIYRVLTWWFCFSCYIFTLITSPPIGGGRGIVMPMSVCLFVCVCVCLSVFSLNFKV